MLLLTRRIGETILVGDDIAIKVVAITKTNSVRLGIEAPREIVVRREEDYNSTQQDSSQSEK